MDVTEEFNLGWEEGRASMEVEVDQLRAALSQAETVMMIVEPRSHRAEYLAALDAIRKALAR